MAHPLLCVGAAEHAAATCQSTSAAGYGSCAWSRASPGRVCGLQQLPAQSGRRKPRHLCYVHGAPRHAASRKPRRWLQAAAGDGGEDAARDGAEPRGGSEGEEVGVHIEIAPSVLKQFGGDGGDGPSFSTSLIDRNQKKRKVQKEASAATASATAGDVVTPGSKLDSHLAALDRLLGPRVDKYASPAPSPFPPAAPPEPRVVQRQDEAKAAEGGEEEEERIDDRIRYGTALLNQPAIEYQLELDIDTSEWWYPRAVLLWTTFRASLIRMKDVDDESYEENMDREAAFLINAVWGEYDPKEVLDTNFRQVQSSSDMVSRVFVGADGKGINEESDSGKEWLFLADMYNGPGKRPSLVSTWGEREWLAKNVFEGSSFNLIGDGLKCQHGLLFFGTISGVSAAQARQELQERMDKNYFFKFLPVLLREVGDEEEVQCLVCSPQNLLSLRIPEEYQALILFGLSLGVAFGASQGVSADPSPIGLSLWEQCIVPMGLLSVMSLSHVVKKAVASAHGVSHQVMLPLYLPAPHLGALAASTPYLGCLPNRKCVLDLSVYSSLASLTLSSLFILAGSRSSLSPQAQGISNAVADLTGFVAVPADVIAHSGPLTWLLNHLAVATSSTDAGGVNVLSPWALAGVLGLHITAMTLLPIGILDGGRILTALLGRGWRFLKFLVYVAVAASIGASGSFFSAATWSLFILQMSGDDWYQLDEVTEPNVFTKLVACILLLAGAACFLVPLTALPSI